MSYDAETVAAARASLCGPKYRSEAARLWRAVAALAPAGTTETAEDSNVAAEESAYPIQNFSIVLKGANVGDSIEYYIDGQLVATHAGSAGPRASANLTVFFSCNDDTSGTGQIKVGAVSVEWTRG